MPRDDARRLTDLLHPEPLHPTTPDQSERGAEYPLFRRPVVRSPVGRRARGRGAGDGGDGGDLGRESSVTVTVNILDIYRIVCLIALLRGSLPVPDPEMDVGLRR